MKIFSLEIPHTNPCDTFSQLANLPYSLFLDSADREHMDARYSYIVTQPVETIESKDGIVTITNAAQKTSFRADAFTMVQDRLNAWEFAPEKISGLPPFQGGAAGYFGYDLARQIENLPSTASCNDIPDMAIGIYDQVIAFDHHENKAWIITHAHSQEEAGRKQRFVLSIKKMTPSPLGENDGGQKPLEWHSNFTHAAYTSAVQKTIDYIYAGDIFQANLSQRFEADLPQNFNAFDHYQHLRTINPAPFAAYMNAGAVQISSASPERFLSVRNNRIETKPIKGTIRREFSNDAAQIKKLETSDKDRAENVMIVDLLRNDLSKICVPESVAVEKLCAVETFANVHHLVSTISGEISKTHTALDALRACFPGGSITGAPKIRAMEIIEEIEGIRRGPYCGAIGYIGFDGSMDTNILIRTLVYADKKVSLNAGGGITAASDPQAEYEETLVKASRILMSFEKDEERKATRKKA